MTIRHSRKYGQDPDGGNGNQPKTVGITSPAIFFELQSDTTPGILSDQLGSIRKAGIGEVIVRPGSLDFARLIEGWYQAFEWCLDSARKLDLRLWIHHLPGYPPRSELHIEQEPSLMRKSLAVEIIPRDELGEGSFRAGQFLVAGRLQGDRITKTHVLPDLHALQAIESNWLIFNCHMRRDTGQVDLLSLPTVRWLIDHVYEPYRRNFGNDFGNTIRAVYTSETQIRWPRHESMPSLPFTEAFFTLFEDRYGESAAAGIPYLLYPGDGAASFRDRFWSLASELMNTTYHTEMAEWCRANGLYYLAGPSGIPDSEEDLSFDGDPFTLSTITDFPGAIACSGSSIYSKIASSQAHAIGKPFSISACVDLGDDASTENAKNTAIKLFCDGINMPILKAAPAHPKLKQVSEYIQLMSDYMSKGRHFCKLLVLYPLSGRMAAYQPGKKTPELDSIESFLDSMLIELTKRQIGYDLISAAMLSDAVLDSSSIVIGSEKYDALMVPYTPYMKPEHYEIIRRVGEKVETYFFYQSMLPAPNNTPSQDNRIVFVPTEDLPGFIIKLRHSLDDGIHLIGQGREDVVLLQRKDDATKIVFMVNTSRHKREFTARFAGKVQVISIETIDGSQNALECSLHGKSTDFPVTLKPYESLLLTVTETK
jgi:hypothetical protein